MLQLAVIDMELDDCVACWMQPNGSRTKKVCSSLVARVAHDRIMLRVLRGVHVLQRIRVIEEAAYPGHRGKWTRPSVAACVSCCMVDTTVTSLGLTDVTVNIREFFRGRSKNSMETARSIGSSARARCSSALVRTCSCRWRACYWLTHSRLCHQRALSH